MLVKTFLRVLVECGELGIEVVDNTRCTILVRTHVHDNSKVLVCSVAGIFERKAERSGNAEQMAVDYAAFYAVCSRNLPRITC